AASLWIVRRVGRLLEKRANARLGWLGERMVAEHLQACGAAGFHLVHDVPAENNGHEFNLDHVAIGENALVVIETKMRSKPADKASHEIEVVFDGKRLSWPRYSNDTKSVWQVGAAADWLRGFVRQECGIDVSVKTVIAIPGWKVKEKILSQPRVVSGKGVAAAVEQAANAISAMPLSRDQREKIRQILESKCRDTQH
ncbi:MAG: NERD domain-containing protein, partial [Verrucomicrobiae bacterium]|nr:NERD domain-containing protein [Verrucomicrobiae bacterium]